MKNIKMDSIGISEECSNYIERLFYEYNTKKDVMATIFELHKNDTDSKVLNSIPFKYYEVEFLKAKIRYDQALRNIKDTIIPEKYRGENYWFKVDFNDLKVDIYVTK